MISELLLYAELGLRHILDPGGLDHVLFVAALCAVYPPREWRRVLWLVTAFTAGHSATLALATLGWVRAPEAVVETLIPLTILATCVANLWEEARGAGHLPPGLKYATAAVFGLVHGLGFSTYLRALLGEEAGIALPLLAFNLGLEAGQALVVLAFFAVAGVVAGRLLPRRAWNAALSLAAGAAALAWLAGGRAG
jgi:hypothetical protein